MNPPLPREFFIPDVEARKMPDGRLYVYGSNDLSGDSNYCSDRYYTFSTTDLIHWKQHGPIFSAGSQSSDALQQPVTLGGPDAIHKDGKYYLYYCTSNIGEGMAVADDPFGPFVDPKPILHADGDSIDPAVFVDDDGQAYYFWGQFDLRGAKLKDDMCTLDMDTFNGRILTEQQHGFHEGASMRKYKGKYYLVYTDITRGRATCLSYAIGDTPLGPFERKGVLIDNTGCDPLCWNNHGSIEEFNGQWYLFYQRSSQNSIYSRRLCIEPITILEDGTISEVEMTSQGAGAPINAFLPIDASCACRVKKSLPREDRIPIHISPKPGQGEIVTYTGDGDWAEYKYIDFREGGDKISILVASARDCIIDVMIEKGEVISSCSISATGSWNVFSWYEYTLKRRIHGVHTVWLNFKQVPGGVGRLADVGAFMFTIL